MGVTGGSLLLVVACAFAAPPHNQPAPSLPSIPILISALQATVRIETFILDGDPGLVDDPSVPNIAGYRITGPGPAPDLGLAQRLIRIVERANDVDCGTPKPTLCEFAPTLAFRFHKAGTPLDLLVSKDCTSFRFRCGLWDASQWISDGRGGYVVGADGLPLGGLGQSTACVTDSLLSICRRLFPKEYEVRSVDKARR
jgi:hypothetical protein